MRIMTQRMYLDAPGEAGCPDRKGPSVCNVASVRRPHGIERCAGYEAYWRDWKAKGDASMFELGLQSYRNSFTLL